MKIYTPAELRSLALQYVEKAEHTPCVMCKRMFKQHAADLLNRAREQETTEESRKS